MNAIQTAFGRVFQQTMRLASYFMPFREPQLLEGMDAITAILKEKGIKSTIIITDDIINNKLKLTEGLKSSLTNGGISYVVFDKTVPNPTIDNIEEALQMYGANQCAAIIAFGGGSAIDCAKGVACRVLRPNKSIPQMKGLLKVRKRYKSFFAIPTTSGTGSEATVAAVVTNPTTHEKYAINDPSLIPAYAVLEPKLTTGLPPHITSTTGMDTLTHAVEAFVGSANTAKTKEMAIKTVKLVFENLQTAYEDGKNETARRNMQIASYCGGVAFTRAYVGNVHAMAHCLGGFYGTPHGLANAVILPYILDFYGAKAHKKLAILADAVGIGGTNTTEKAENFVTAVKKLNDDMKIPKTIDAIKTEDIPTMAKRAYKEAYPLYPVPVMMTVSDFEALYAKLKG